MHARRLTGWVAAATVALPAAPAAAALAPATPDPQFGTAGIARFGGVTPAGAELAIDAAERPVLATRDGTDIALVRALPGGTRDASFTAAPLPAGVEAGAVAALAVQGSGYLAGGTTAGPFGSFLLARYDGDGDLDPAFGEDGVAVGPEGQLDALAVNAQGGILTAGSDAAGEAQLVRYDPQGEVVLAKPMVVPGVTGERIGALAPTAESGALVAGTALVGTDRRVLLARLTPQGELDPLFGTGGATLVDVGDLETAVRAIAVQPDGKVLVGGTTDADGGGGGFVVRFTSAGAPDARFSTDGIARLGVPSAVADALALQPDGKILVAGAADLAAPDTDGIVARFRPGGLRDPGFGSDGVARRSLGAEADDELTGVAVTAAGRILAGGFTPSELMLERLVGGDAADPAVTMSAEGVGDLITFTITVPNHGPDPVQGVQVAVRPPGAGDAAAALSTPEGECPGTVCAVGTIAPGAIGRVKVLARASRAGSLAASATVSSATYDLDPSNNSAGATGATTRLFAPDRTKPRVGLRIPQERARQIRRNGFRLKYFVSEAASVSLVVRNRGKTFARTRVRVSQKTTRTLKIRLTAAGRQALKQALKRKHGQRLKLRATARARDVWDNPRTKTVRKTLRR